MKANKAVNTEADSAPAPEASAPAPESTDLPKPVLEEVLAEPATDVNDQSLDAETETPAGDAKNPIPYDRFKEKVDQTNQLKEANDLLMQQIESLKQLRQGTAEEKPPEPEEIDPILQRLEELDEYESESEMAGIVRDMAGELATLRKQSSYSSQSVQDMRIQGKVQQIEKEIAGHAQEAKVHDQSAARVFVLESMSRDTSLNVGDLVQHFAKWESDQEDTILKRLGMARPEAKAKADAKSDVPPRPATVSGSSPSRGEATAAPEAGLTLKGMRQKLLQSKSRRR